MSKTIFTLKKILHSINTSAIKKIAKEEIENLDPLLLPLQQGLTHSSYVGNAPFKAVVLNITSEKENIAVKSGVFYTGIIAGCSCSDDPSPTDEQNEYCELLFMINKQTAETSVKLLED